MRTAITRLFAAAALAACLVPSVALAQAKTLCDDPLKPCLSVPIPELKFSDITVVERDGAIVNNVPYLVDYINGVYRYALGIAVIIAAVMMMIGGFRYLTAGGDMGKVSQGKENITNAVIGLTLAFTAFIILNTVNPELTTLRSIEVLGAKRIEYVPPEDEPDSVNGTLDTNFKAPKGANISGKGVGEVPSSLTADIEAVATELNAKGMGISIASSFRSEAKQKELIAQNCKNPPGSATCDPKPGQAQTCILKNGPSSCPHTTGRALDMWATGTGCITDSKTCKAGATAAERKASNTTCAQNTCQAALISAMRAKGFCNLSSEAWHFEKPKMSGNCN